MYRKTLKLIPAAFVLMISISGCQNGGVITGTPPAITTILTQDIARTVSPTSTIASASQTASPVETMVATASENPIAPEKNPPGDIPDTQVFVKYANAVGGYELETPEGWARTENGTDVAFVDKFDGVQVAIMQSSVSFTVDGIKTNQATTLQNTGRAVEIKSVLEKKTKGGQAILVTYESNSEPDAVTGKQVRLEDQCYFFYKDGKLAALTLWAPLGADNVDQWKLMSDSFRWQ